MHYGHKTGLLFAALVLGLVLGVAACPKRAPQSTGAGGAAAPAAKAAPILQHPPAVHPPRGTSGEVTTTAFTVTGMTGSDCSAAIESTLIKLPGVTTVSADYKTGIAKVQYDPQQSTPAQLIAAIGKLGYKAKVREEPPPGPPRSGGKGAGA